MILWLGLVMALGLASCARVVPPVAPPPSPPTAPPPHFEKTFGSVQPLTNAGLTIDYKGIVIAVDPVADKPLADYVFLTGVDARRWSQALQLELRKNTKILCAVTDAPTVKKAGFTEIKTLSPGQRLLLKKENAFLFASATAGQSYFLEFDSGKNLFIGGDLTRPDPLREFVYSLRDDGRAIDIGFFHVEPSFDEALLAQVVGLLQPKNSVFIKEPGGQILDLNHFRETLKTEFYEGPVILATQDAIPF